MKIPDFIIDKSNGKLEDVLAIARTHPAKKTLEHCFDVLNSVRGDNQVTLYYDWAPLSLAFHIENTKRTSSLSGGIIYHGSGVDPLSVTLDPTDGWQVHT